MSEEVCWPDGPQHDWVDEWEHEGKLYYTCDRCGEESK